VGSVILFPTRAARDHAPRQRIGVANRLDGHVEQNENNGGASQAHMTGIVGIAHWRQERRSAQGPTNEPTRVLAFPA
jgi:hypothetical protein